MQKYLFAIFITFCHINSTRGDWKEDLAEKQCWLIASYGLFFLTGLEKTDGDYTHVISQTDPSTDPETGEELPGTSETITYNFCTYT